MYIAVRRDFDFLVRVTPVVVCCSSLCYELRRFVSTFATCALRESPRNVVRGRSAGLFVVLSEVEEFLQFLLTQPLAFLWGKLLACVLVVS